MTTVYLYHERIALNVYFKIFLLFFFSFFNWNLFSDLNFLFLISSAWLMHEGKGPKMALRHRWSAGDLLSFPCKLASGCPRLDLAPSFSFGCSSPRGAVPQPGITQQLSGHPSSPWIPPADLHSSLSQMAASLRAAGWGMMENPLNPEEVRGMHRRVGQR